MSLYVAQQYATERNKEIDHASGRTRGATSCKNGQHHARRRRGSYRRGPETEVPATSHTESRATFRGAKPITRDARERDSESPAPMTALWDDDPWRDCRSAAAFLGLTPSGVRSLVSRGVLSPDGRGPRRTLMFRRSTLDRWIADGCQRYAAQRYATSGTSLSPRRSRRCSSNTASGSYKTRPQGSPRAWCSRAVSEPITATPRSESPSSELYRRPASTTASPFTAFAEPGTTSSAKWPRARSRVR